MIRTRNIWAVALTVVSGMVGCERQTAPAKPADTGAPASPTPASATPAATTNGPRPNVIVILVDTLRADALGTYGHAAGLAPALDEFAGEGLVFERAHAAAPWTQPSIASLFASVYVGVHRIANYNQAMAQAYGGQPKVAVFADRFDTLAERFRAAGYATAGVSANPFILAEFGFSQGFEHFDATHAGNDIPGSVVNEAALAWLKKRPADRPFFLYLHYMDVHGPYPTDPRVLGPLLDAVEALPDKHEVPAEVIARLGYLGQLPPNTPDLERHEKLQRFREYWVARYEAGVKQFDGHFAEVRNDLKTLGLWDSSCVVVLSDHGEQLAEKGAWNHGDSVWETELHVPLMLRWPGQVPAGRRVTQLVSLVDLGPTLLDLLDLPAAERVQGRSLLPLLEEGAATQSPRAIMAEGVKRPPEQKALLLGRWKLIQYFDTGRQALYDLAADPGEQHDLAGTHAEKVKAYQELLDAQLIDNGKLAEGGAVQQVDLTPAQIKRLRDLGYLGE